jgi:hypothetical protein
MDCKCLNVVVFYRYSTEELKGQEIHGDKYDYSNLNICNNLTKE